MSFLRRFLRRPQGVWLRKAIFQVHLWTGVAIGVYVLLMSLSGTVLIYRRGLVRMFQHEPVIAATAGPRLTTDQLKQAARRAYPNYDIAEVFERKNPRRPAEIWFQRGENKLQRLFNPFTGADLGDAVPRGIRAIDWLLDFHDNLLGAHTGRLINGAGGVALTLISLTGIVIWWPGIDKWRRSLSVDWKANWKRFNWSLHGALGFWSVAFIFMWGFSGIYLCLPQPFDAAIGFLDPLYESSLKIAWGDRFLFRLAQLHFGRFGGLPMELAWTVFGLVPAALFVTGTLMWWNRVLRPWLRGSERSNAQVAEVANISSEGGTGMAG